MKLLRFIFSLLLAGGLVFALNSKIGMAPPFGKLFDPVHGFWQNSETPGIHFPDNLDLPGLNSPVTIEFEDNLIPHIFATDDHDIYYAQGYITAKYRLWQMDFITRAAAGRISRYRRQSSE